MKRTFIPRLLALLLALCLVLPLVACEEETPPDDDIRPGGDLYAMLEMDLALIYDVGGYSKMLTDLLNAPASDDHTFQNHLVTTRITEENEMYFLGSTELVYDAAIASEPAISPTLYSLCLLVTASPEQGKTLAEELKKSANPRKWVCTGLSEDKVYVAQSGIFVLLVMSAEDGEALTDAFYEVVHVPRATDC